MRDDLPPGNLSAIRCWLMAERPWPPESQADEGAIKTYLLHEAARIETLLLEQLVRAAEAQAQQDRHRSERLLRWSWRNESIRLSDFGTWRTVGDALPIEACRGSALEAAAFVHRFPHGLPGPQGPQFAANYLEHVSKIRELAKHSSMLRSIPLLSILAAERSQRGREGCEALRFSCEDGSHRAIAMALAGYETIDAWIAY